MELLCGILNQELDLFPSVDGWLSETPEYGGLYKVYIPEIKDVYTVTVCRDQCHAQINLPITVQFTTAICELSNELGFEPIMNI